MNVGILYVCTGPYTVFWDTFYESCERCFLKDTHREYFVFTDAEHLTGQESGNVHLYYHERRKWPYDTLFRYHIFSEQRDAFVDMDYLFFFNANALFMQEITEEQVLPDYENKDITVVRHPGAFYSADSHFERNSYEKNAQSTAYIPDDKGEYYVCGGINGGKREAFLRLAETLQDQIDIDLRNDIIARAHDESQLNQYVSTHDDWRMLTPAFCYPEGEELPFEPVIMVRDKSRYFDTVRDKYGAGRAMLRDVKNFVKRVVRRGETGLKRTAQS